MKCPGCGNRIEFWGVTCPYCGEDKSEAQSVRLLAGLGILVIAVFGYGLWGVLGFLGVSAAGGSAVFLLGRALDRRHGG